MQTARGSLIHSVVNQERAWYDRMKRLDTSSPDGGDDAPFGMHGSFSMGGFTFGFGRPNPFFSRPNYTGPFPCPPKNNSKGGLTVDDIAILQHSCMRSPRPDPAGDGPQVSTSPFPLKDWSIYD